MDLFFYTYGWVDMLFSYESQYFDKYLNYDKIYELINLSQILYFFNQKLRIHFILFHVCSIIAQESASWESVMTRGGENLIMFFWVGLAISPFYKSFFEKLYANLSEWNWTPTNRPFPRMSWMCYPFKIWARFVLKTFPNLSEF